MAQGTFDLVIVGGGNMGAALAEGLLAGGIVAADQLAVAEALGDRRTQLVDLLPGVHVADTVPPTAAAVLAVKPPDVPDAAAAAVAAGARRLLSIAAGVTTRQIERAAGGVTPDPVAVIRAMPNTPALVGEGASAISGGSSATDEDLAWAEAVLGGVGLVVRVAESQLDAVTGLSGSGPAYVFLVAEALIAAAVDVGLDPDLAADADDAAARRLCGTARRARRPGSAAGDGHVAGRDNRRRASGARRTGACGTRSARRSRRRPHAAASCRRTTDGRSHQRQMRISAITPATRIRARSRAIVSVVAGRMALDATGDG